MGSIFIDSNAALGGCLAGLTRGPSKGGLDHCSTEGRGAVPFTHHALASTMQTAAETRIRPNHGSCNVEMRRPRGGRLQLQLASWDHDSNFEAWVACASRRLIADSDVPSQGCRTGPTGPRREWAPAAEETETYGTRIGWYETLAEKLHLENCYDEYESLWANSCGDVAERHCPSAQVGGCGQIAGSGHCLNGHMPDP